MVCTNFTCFLWLLHVIIEFEQGGSNNETDTVPTPKVIVDLDSDPDATVVEITFGDRLGALLDTVWGNLLTCLDIC